MSGRILHGSGLQNPLRDTTLGEFFLKQARKFPEATCQIDGDLHESETYGSFINRCIRLAKHLQKKGVTSNDVISCCSYNTLDNTVPIVATILLGAKITNLDPTLSARNTKHLLELVTPKLVFADLDSLDLIESCTKGLAFSTEIIVLGKSDRHTQLSDLTESCGDEDDFTAAKVNVNDVTVMYFSSGTTGLPKAICHNHSACLEMIQCLPFGRHDHAVFLHSTSMYWISGVLMMLRAFYTCGSRLFTRNLDGDHLFELIEKYKVTDVFLAPILTYSFTNVKNPERYDFSSLNCLLTGGTPISRMHFTRLLQLFSDAKIIFGYGMTEIGVVTVFDPETDEHLIRTKIGASGKPGPNSSVKIVDPNTGALLGPNQPGEIRVKTTMVMVGYFKQDGADIFDEDGFLKTGDIGYYDDDDCVFVVDRIKEMFKYLSWHIVPNELESVLLEHPAVKEAVVFGTPAGEKGEVPTACVILKDNYAGQVAEEELEKFVAERVLDREKLRGGIIFVEALPKTPTGKVIRNQIKTTVTKQCKC